MVTPINVQGFAVPLDPKDKRRYKVKLGPMVDAGAGVASWTITPTAAFTAAGALVSAGGGYDPVYNPSDVSVVLYFEVSAGQQAAAIFDDPGIALALEATVVSDQSPAQTIQRTFVLTVVQQ